MNRQLYKAVLLALVAASLALVFSACKAEEKEPEIVPESFEE